MEAMLGMGRSPMSYARPQEVVGPKKHFGGVIEVIHDPGENKMSVARIFWNGEESRLSPRAGMVMQATPWQPGITRARHWFVIDGYVAESVEQAARNAAQASPSGLLSKYREMAEDEEREREAEEWSEGLIGDGNA